MKPRRFPMGIFGALVTTYVGVMALPLIGLPFGQSVSLFALLGGALSGGYWAFPRLLLAGTVALSAVSVGLLLLGARRPLMRVRLEGAAIASKAAALAAASCLLATADFG